ncbi:FdhE protein [Ardenticatena maritima]|uniref:FdhE protein n=1 Tax=Ardenticatena maritima TaxID=872965 RepID=A0A0M9UCD0_9CHLR|nr:formate dehydrogenase accessory protein FdhE [Ardenticatena maritima]GAP62730.1 FdhE protein [Ardenticatena maritima]
MKHTLADLAEALAAQSANAPEDEADLLHFYHRLFALLAQQQAALELDLSKHLADFSRKQWLRSGEPALRFEWLGLAPSTFHPWVEQVAALLRERVPECQAPTPEESVELAARYYHDNTTGKGAAMDALMQSALTPWLWEAAAQLTPHLPLDEWLRGYCPVCGGFPDFEVIVSNKWRRLLCERCAAEWRFPNGVCPFCGEDSPDMLGFYTTEDEVYRIDVCDACGSYIKGVDSRRFEGTLNAVLERFLTPGLDYSAVEQGYTRPEAFEDFAEGDET